VNISTIRSEVRKVTEQLIPENANSYDATHKLRYARTLEVILDSYESGPILELGTSSVIPVALELLGIDADISVTNFDLSQTITGSFTCEVAGLSREAKRYSVDLESTPLPAKDQTYGLVLCCEVIEHMDVDPMFMLSEINRVLPVGGKMIISTPNITSSQGLWKMLRGIEPYFFMQYHKDRSPYRHNYEHSVDTLSALLSGAGFEYEIWTENTFEPGISEDIGRLKAAGYKIREDRLGDNIFAVATKVSGVVDRHPGLVYV
jgi:SAM-dependent methyltransferase